MMGTPLLCIRNKTFFSQIWRREVRRGEAGKKSPCIQTGGPAELMGSGRLFCGETICIMGKCLESELRALLLWGQSVKWKEESERQGGRKPERPLSAGGPTEVLQVGDARSRYAFSPAATFPFHLQNNLPTISQTTPGRYAPPHPAF